MLPNGYATRRAQLLSEQGHYLKLKYKTDHYVATQHEL
jgi:hypothetical protein